jgi:N-methylhydantoinase A
VDVGGTFTDVVGIAADGAETLAKAASTPHDQSEGVLAGLENLAAALGLPLAELLGRTARIVHGTTVATNALLERRGARVAMLTTEGHRDVVEMREGLKPGALRPADAAAAPLVPRRLRLPVRERLRADGSVLAPLDPASLDTPIAVLREEAVESVAVCFLHSWRDGRHEREAADALRAALPGVHVTLSSEVLPQIKEFERFSTAVVNAYVGPAVGPLPRPLGGAAGGAGYSGPLFVILSHGGVAPVAKRAPRRRHRAFRPRGRRRGGRGAGGGGVAPDLVTFDMGGTSTDIALVSGGEAALGRGREVAGERIALESLDIVTLGAGGGSVAHLGPGGTLQVGPRSAGAVPGPACYGAGGTEPTVTDANLVLGYLDPGNFLGGRKTLDRARRSAPSPPGGAPGHRTVDCAAGIHALVNARMATACGWRRCGAAWTRATTRCSPSAAPPGCTRAPWRPSSASAAPWCRSSPPAFPPGGCCTPTSATRSRAAPSTAGGGLPDDAALRALFDGLEAEARARVAGWFGGEVAARAAPTCATASRCSRSRCRWTAWTGTRPACPRGSRRLPRPPPRPLHLRPAGGGGGAGQRPRVGRRPAARGRAARASLRQAPAAPVAHRRIHLAGAAAEAPVFRFAALAPDQALAGPAVVESETTTVLLRPGDGARMDGRGWLDIAVAAG